MWPFHWGLLGITLFVVVTNGASINTDVSEYKQNIIRHYNDRIKRSARGFMRGQTQSQYLNFGNPEQDGKAEAEATETGSRSTVSGSHGMGQAQSQFSMGDCSECGGAQAYEYPVGSSDPLRMTSGGGGVINGPEAAGGRVGHMYPMPNRLPGTPGFSHGEPLTGQVGRESSDSQQGPVRVIGGFVGPGSEGKPSDIIDQGPAAPGTRFRPGYGVGAPGEMRPDVVSGQGAIARPSGGISAGGVSEPAVGPGTGAGGIGSISPAGGVAGISPGGGVVPGRGVLPGGVRITGGPISGVSPGGVVEPGAGVGAGSGIGIGPGGSVGREEVAGPRGSTIPGVGSVSGFGIQDSSRPGFAVTPGGSVGQKPYVGPTSVSDIGPTGTGRPFIPYDVSEAGLHAHPAYPEQVRGGGQPAGISSDPRMRTKPGEQIGGIAQPVQVSGAGTHQQVPGSQPPYGTPITTAPQSTGTYGSQPAGYITPGIQPGNELSYGSFVPGTNIFTPAAGQPSFHKQIGDVYGPGWQYGGANQPGAAGQTPGFDVPRELLGHLPPDLTQQGGRPGGAYLGDLQPDKSQQSVPGIFSQPGTILRPGSVSDPSMNQHPHTMPGTAGTYGTGIHPRYEPITGYRPETQLGQGGIKQPLQSETAYTNGFYGPFTGYDAVAAQGPKIIQGAQPSGRYDQIFHPSKASGQQPTGLYGHGAGTQPSSSSANGRQPWGTYPSTGTHPDSDRQMGSPYGLVHPDINAGRPSSSIYSPGASFATGAQPGSGIQPSSLYRPDSTGVQPGGSGMYRHVPASGAQGYVGAGQQPSNMYGSTGRDGHQPSDTSRLGAENGIYGPGASYGTSTQPARSYRPDSAISTAMPPGGTPMYGRVPSSTDQSSVSAGQQPTNVYGSIGRDGQKPSDTSRLGTGLQPSGYYGSGISEQPHPGTGVYRDDSGAIIQPSSGRPSADLSGLQPGSSYDSRISEHPQLGAGALLPGTGITAQHQPGQYVGGSGQRTIPQPSFYGPAGMQPVDGQRPSAGITQTPSSGVQVPVSLQTSDGYPSSAVQGGNVLASQGDSGILIKDTGASSADDAFSQAESSINNGQAAASAQGQKNGGTAKTMVSGTYSSTGTFSASAMTSDTDRSANSQVSGNADGAMSQSQGQGGPAQSQAQVQVNHKNGGTKASSQSGGVIHQSQSNVQANDKGGLADAQSSGPGQTSSQAQIGFRPRQDNSEVTTSDGGGKASAQSGSHSGQSQSQIQGKSKFGVSYHGAAQSASGTKEQVATYREQNRELFHSISQFGNTDSVTDRVDTVYSGPALTSESEIIPDLQLKASKTSVNGNKQDNDDTTTPEEEEDDDEEPYDEYEDDDYYNEKPIKMDSKSKTATPLSLTTSSESNTPSKKIDPYSNFHTYTQKSPTQSQQAAVSNANDRYSVVQNQNGHVVKYPVRTTTEAVPNGFRGTVNVEKKFHTKALETHKTDNKIKVGIEDEDATKINEPDSYVTVTKSVTGSMDNTKNPPQESKNFQSTYYTKSSTCGYFTFSCNIVYGANGRSKICRPKAPTNGKC